jgi:hypothetical protein
VIARLKLAPRWIAVAAAFVIVAGLMVIIGRQADAAIFGGPPTISSPGAEYAPGSVVYGCVNLVTEQFRIEVHSDVPGNCAANEVQLPVVVPSPYPTPPHS